MVDGVRHLATVEEVVSVRPIEGADAIEVARVRGWDTVVKIGEFRPGDLCVYFEVDSMLDVTRPQFEFLAGRGARTDADGNTGHVLRTMKLRGQYSQGLAIPVGAFPEIRPGTPVGADVSKLLGVIKWEPPIPAGLSGTLAGPFPPWTHKTDAERVQNLGWAFPLDPHAGWRATEKIDGMSATFTLDPDTGEMVVASRNWRIATNPNHVMWRLAADHDLSGRLESLWSSGAPSEVPAIQGEVYGEGIQSNPLRVRGQHLAVFNLSRGMLRCGVDREAAPSLPWVPTVGLGVPGSSDEALAQVDGMESLICPGRQAEGVVWSAPGVEPWKAINNRYLAKQKD